ncbi:GNAT family N-acetyltransferase [Trinickia fusca]|uniref:GNAT family N-acetyltransferase n=1 Tax=Trinickia fusca TaxID=2419777 RepID=A0A494XC56_9BURK|nr:GNAT family N-acetyltransferase [Trinickia fusca]RKP48335.1 GNAT family N-acetyltransferase [Trinickia fusca]
MNATQSIEQEGSRFEIRPRESFDGEAIAQLMNLPGVRHGTLIQPYVLASTLTEREKGSSERSVRLCATIDGDIVGHGTLLVHKPRRSHCGNVALSVHDAYVDRGIGTALMHAMIDCADRQLGLRRLELTVFADNARAIALYRKFGFADEGYSRAYAVRDGELADVLHLARLVDAPAFASL